MGLIDGEQVRLRVLVVDAVQEAVKSLLDFLDPTRGKQVLEKGVLLGVLEIGEGEVGKKFVDFGQLVSLGDQVLFEVLDDILELGEREPGFFLAGLFGGRQDVVETEVDIHEELGDDGVFVVDAERERNVFAPEIEEILLVSLGKGVFQLLGEVVEFRDFFLGNFALKRLQSERHVEFE